MSEHVYAALLVNGAPVYARFDDEEAYDDFVRSVNYDWQALQTLVGADGKPFLLRPSSVDAIFKDSQPSG